MAIILCIETATQVCSVALSDNGTTMALEESSARNAHSSVITLFIEKVLAQAGKRFQDLDAVAVSEGPGSYTGLRIGVATAKGICYATGKPLIAVGTLQALSNEMKEIYLKNRKEDKPVLFVPMIDARRMEVYCAVYDMNGKEVRPPSAEIITENSFADLFAGNFLVFAGDGAAKCKSLLEQNTGAYFPEDLNASAKFICELAEEKFISGKFEDTAYFEPFYLKDFVAGKPKVKGLK
jgi:tRNA threonylcarbamoyladenosine biosynthesis protein TsaB